MTNDALNVYIRVCKFKIIKYDISEHTPAYVYVHDAKCSPAHSILREPNILLHFIILFHKNKAVKPLKCPVLFVLVFTHFRQTR